MSDKQSIKEMENTLGKLEALISSTTANQKNQRLRITRKLLMQEIEKAKVGVDDE